MLKLYCWNYASVYTLGTFSPACTLFQRWKIKKYSRLFGKFVTNVSRSPPKVCYFTYDIARLTDATGIEDHVFLSHLYASGWKLLPFFYCLLNQIFTLTDQWNFLFAFRCHPHCSLGIKINVLGLLMCRHHSLNQPINDSGKEINKTTTQRPRDVFQETK